MTTSTSPTSPFASSQPIRVRTLGDFEIDVDGAPVRYGRAVPRKPLMLLQSLVALGGRTLSTHVACETLWPEADGFDAYRSLVTTSYRLRRLLRHPRALQSCGQGLRLDAHLVWVDAWTFETELADANPLPQLAAALELYRGPFLGDVEHPHAFEARERLQRRYARSVRLVAQRYETQGDTAAAIALYERALDVGVTSEEIHRELMQCLIRVGQTSAAAQVFQRCRTLLARRLGISPSASTVMAFRSIEQATRDQRVTESS
jgi:two-component SAPR family response regulator